MLSCLHSTGTSSESSDVLNAAGNGSQTIFLHSSSILGYISSGLGDMIVLVYLSLVLPFPQLQGIRQLLTLLFSEDLFIIWYILHVFLSEDS